LTSYHKHAKLIHTEEKIMSMNHDAKPKDDELERM